MLDLKFIKQNPEAVRKAIAQKNAPLDLDALLKSEEIVRALKQEIEGLQAERNANAKWMSQASDNEKKRGILRGKEIGEALVERKVSLQKEERQLQELLLLVPNIPDEKAPVGPNAAHNVEVRHWQTPTQFDFSPLDHIELLKKHGWAELQRIAHVCGSRTYSLKNEAVFLEMALLQFAMQQAVSHQFQLLTLPALVKEAPLVGTGHFPFGKDQVYSIPEDGLYLAGTSEVVINSLHAGEILDEGRLPLLYAGFSPCFRREAGSAGRDVRGLIRVHQFYKVELFVICRSDLEESQFWLNELLLLSEKILQGLELPYRVIECCTGDMGLGKVKMYDLESWVPSESKYRETHSCSMLFDWQARRSNLRYRSSKGGVRFCHTLNNTAIATPRVLVPFLENHQQKGGSIRIPAALRPFLSGKAALPSPNNLEGFPEKPFTI